KDIVFVRIDRRRKLPVTTLLYALGLDSEEILSTFYNSIAFTKVKNGWRVPFDADRYRGVKPERDLVDAKTGKVAVEAGRKMTPRLAKKLAEGGLKELLVQDEERFGRYRAAEIANMETGEIFAEAGDEVTPELLESLVEAGYDEILTLDIDHVNTGAFIRNTLAADKCTNREQALVDIYRGM